jgi:hypothetical protein
MISGTTDLSIRILRPVFLDAFGSGEQRLHSLRAHIFPGSEVNEGNVVEAQPGFVSVGSQPLKKTNFRIVVGLTLAALDASERGEADSDHGG